MFKLKMFFAFSIGALIIFTWLTINGDVRVGLWPRIWGTGLTIASVLFMFSENIPVGISGRSPSFYLSGWKKSYVLVPALMLGLVNLIFPHETACAINLRGYVCT